ncbi:flagellar basal body rod protein [Opitutaceae bacterium TAV1]|nr:flagellar basal body rod protein [Opitutaceae bacterium TAV1]
MNIGLYQNAASLSALERWQDVVAQNIVSSQVTAFKRRTVQVAGNQSGEFFIEPSSVPGASGEARRAIFPQANYNISLTPGEALPTHRDLDIALPADGFFTVRDAGGRILYTRAGSFQISPERTLVTAEGLEVLGDGEAPIQLETEGGTLVFNDDGTVSQDDTLIGRLGIVTFARPELLTPLSGGLYAAPPEAGPEPVEEPGVIQGFVESSNVAQLHEMVDLITISRAYEANQKMIQSRDNLLGRTIEALTT